MAKKKKEQKPKAHSELGDFNIIVNEFGEIVSTLDHDKLNRFLDEKVIDKKLKNRTPPPDNDQNSITP